MRYALPLIGLLAACTDFPQLEGTISDVARDAPYPTLSPLPASDPIHTTDDSALRARVAALQARAERLRQIDIAALQ